MGKYRPESRSKIERKVKELDYKAKDRSGHMRSVVNDNKVISDVSKKFKSAGTIEADKEIKQDYQRAGTEGERECGHKRKDLEDIVNKAVKTNKELEQRSRYSKLNYEELTSVFGAIKETPAARREINQGQHAAQKDVYTIDFLRDRIERIRKRTTQVFQDSAHAMKKTGIYGPLDSARPYRAAQEIRDAIGAVKKEDKQEIKHKEGEIISEEKQGHEFCKPAKRRFGELQDEMERLKAAGLPPHPKSSPAGAQKDYNIDYDPPLGKKYKRDKS